MIDGKTVTYTLAQGISDQAKTYGPVFSRLVAKESVKLLGKLLSQSPPDIDTLDGAASYIMSNLSRCPRGYACLAYGVGKAISTLEGSVGGGAKMFTKSFLMAAMKKSGLAKASGSPSTIDAVIAYRKLSLAIRLAEEGSGTFSGSEHEANIKVTDCDYSNACIETIREGTSRAIGGNVCVWGVSYGVYAEIATSMQHDYKMIKTEPPNCELVVFRQE
jgi:hypothetical protein